MLENETAPLTVILRIDAIGASLLVNSIYRNGQSSDSTISTMPPPSSILGVFQTLDSRVCIEPSMAVKLDVSNATLGRNVTIAVL